MLTSIVSGQSCRSIGRILCVHCMIRLRLHLLRNTVRGEFLTHCTGGATCGVHVFLLNIGVCVRVYVHVWSMCVCVRACWGGVHNSPFRKKHLRACRAVTMFECADTICIQLVGRCHNNASSPSITSARPVSTLATVNTTKHPPSNSTLCCRPPPPSCSLPCPPHAHLHVIRT